MATLPTYPNVPIAPGVPPLKRNPLIASAATIAVPAIGSLFSDFAPTWGVFDSTGVQVLTPDSFLGMSYRKSSRVARHPIEEGAFSSYNKVREPREIVVRFAKGGTNEDRSSFLATLESLQEDTNLYTVVTPEITYTNINLESFDYRREQQQGAWQIVASCHFIEIRNDATLQITSAANATATASPTAQAEVNQGNIKTVTPSASTQSSAATTFSGGGI